ncbi:MAG: outer membrane protein transport protein [Sphingomonas sp.]
MMGKTFARLAGGLTLSLVAGEAQAGSFYLTQQSVRAAGRATAGEAADQGPESLWWNPAAIGGATRITGALGAVAIFPTARVRDRGTRIARPGQPAAAVGGDPSPPNPAKRGVLPTGAIAVPVTERVALGIAVTSPFSFETNYAADSWTRYIADQTKLLTIDIQPGVAVALTERLRVGAALNVEYSKATLAKALPNLLATLPDGYQQLKGDGWDTGWSAGGQYVGDGISIGLSYKSSIKHKLGGTLAITGLLGPLAASNTRFETTASFRTPWQAIAALRVKATDLVTLNLQVTRFGWNKFDRVRLAIPAGAFIPEDYRNTWNVAAGADYDVSPDLTLRGGVYRDQTPTQDGVRDPNVPDANRTAFALGATQRLTDAIRLDLAFEYIRFDRSGIDRQSIAFEGTPVATQILTNGRLTSGRALTFGAGVRFAL